VSEYYTESWLCDANESNLLHFTTRALREKYFVVYFMVVFKYSSCVIELYIVSNVVIFKIDVDSPNAYAGYC